MRLGYISKMIRDGIHGFRSVGNSDATTTGVQRSMIANISNAVKEDSPLGSNQHRQVGVCPVNGKIS